MCVCKGVCVCKRLILEFKLGKEKSEYMNENVEDQSILYSS